MSEADRLLMSYQRAWRKWQKRAEQAEAARDKALADVERLERVLQEIRDIIHACNRPSTPARVRQEIRGLCDAALKETSGEQDGS